MTPEHRGQLVLVTALGLAALLVVLAVVLNAAVATDLFATRESTSLDATNAERFEHDAVTATAQTLADENALASDSYATKHANVSGQVANWSALAARHAAVDAHSVSLAVVSTVDGTQIRQADAAPLTNANGTADWTLVEDASAVGRFNLTVERSTLVDPADETNATVLAGQGVFAVSYTAGGDVRRVFVYRDGTGVVVRPAAPNGSLDTACHGTGPNASIDLANGTVDGSACASLDPVASPATPVTVGFEHGANASGTYVLVVDRPAIDADVVTDPGAGSPVGTRVVYAATVELRYVSPELTYQRRVRVAGGEWP